MKVFLSFVFFFAFLCKHSFGAVIVLKTGERIEGVVVSLKFGILTVEAFGKRIQFPASRVKCVVFSGKPGPRGTLVGDDLVIGTPLFWDYTKLVLRIGPGKAVVRDQLFIKWVNFDTKVRYRAQKAPFVVRTVNSEFLASEMEFSRGILRVRAGFGDVDIPSEEVISIERKGMEKKSVSPVGLATGSRFSGKLTEIKNGIATFETGWGEVSVPLGDILWFVPPEIGRKATVEKAVSLLPTPFVPKLWERIAELSFDATPALAAGFGNVFVGAGNTIYVIGEDGNVREACEVPGCIVDMFCDCRGRTLWVLTRNGTCVGLKIPDFREKIRFGTWVVPWPTKIRRFKRWVTVYERPLYKVSFFDVKSGSLEKVDVRIWMDNLESDAMGTCLYILEGGVLKKLKFLEATPEVVGRLPFPAFVGKRFLISMDGGIVPFRFEDSPPMAFVPESFDKVAFDEDRFLLAASTGERVVVVYAPFGGYRAMEQGRVDVAREMFAGERDFWGLGWLEMKLGRFRSAAFWFGKGKGWWDKYMSAMCSARVGDFEEALRVVGDAKGTVFSLLRMVAFAGLGMWREFSKEAESLRIDDTTRPLLYRLVKLAPWNVQANVLKKLPKEHVVRMLPIVADRAALEVLRSRAGELGREYEVKLAELLMAYGRISEAKAVVLRLIESNPFDRAPHEILLRIAMLLEDKDLVNRELEILGEGK